MGVLNGGGDRRRGRSSFGSKCGTCHCTVTIGILILCVRGGDAARPKLLWDFLFKTSRANYTSN